jgi:hypothetical protein
MELKGSSVSFFHKALRRDPLEAQHEESVMYSNPLNLKIQTS